MEIMKQWLMIAVLICGTTVFTSCSKNDDPVDPTDNLAEKIIGQWLMEETEGLSLPTDEKIVFTFLSDTKAYMSPSIHTDESESAWDVHREVDVSINGKKVTLIDSLDEHRVRVLELDVTSINDKEMEANWKIIRYIDGKLDASGEGTMSFTKVICDYSEAILGTWEDHEARLEYKVDGTFVYYSQNDAGEWVPSEDDFAEYFVDGNLLCSRWKNSGEGQQENREWWEIKSIENGVMTWTALRQKGDGSTYIVTFELSKVEDKSK